MNGQETRELWDMGRDAWNEWAKEIQRTQANFEEAGAFALSWFGEGETDEARLWVKVATADFANEHFEEEVDFEGYLFPGPVNFSGAIFDRAVSFAGTEFKQPAKFVRAHFHKDANFKGVTFCGQAVFDEASFEGAADFEHAKFTKEQNGLLTISAKFNRTHFAGKADFRSAVFMGSSDFSRAQFAATARFDAAQFTGDAQFDGVIFSAPMSFNAALFAGVAAFKESQFTGEARFSETTFKNSFSLDHAQFWGDVLFREARFEQEAVFTHMRVEGQSRFPGAKFSGASDFTDSRWAHFCDFSNGSFTRAVHFRQARFEEGASWEGCRFAEKADFVGLHLGKSSTFRGSQFEGDTNFREARFEGQISFMRARFEKAANFSAIQSKVAFVLSDTEFKHVPGFLEASFHEPPRVDHMTVGDPLKRFHNWKAAGVADPRPAFCKFMKVSDDPDASAKFRRLKKLAFEAQDQTREQEFFALELRCHRFWHDRPLGHGIARFWLGWLYGGVANFGRSLARPALLWLLSIVLFAFYFLEQRFDALSLFTFSATRQAAAPAPTNSFWTVKSVCVSGHSNAFGEAFYLSFRNALLKLDWQDGSNAKRVFGCLYGVDQTGAPIVPLNVTAMSLFQNVLSGALIFMFLLALRNLLKVR